MVQVGLPRVLTALYLKPPLIIEEATLIQNLYPEALRAKIPISSSGFALIAASTLALVGSRMQSRRRRRTKGKMTCPYS